MINRRITRRSLNERNLLNNRRGLLTESASFDNRLLDELLELWDDLGLPWNTSSTSAWNVGFHNVDSVMGKIEKLGKKYGIRDLPTNLYNLGKQNTDVWYRLFSKYEDENGDSLANCYNLFDMVNWYVGGWKAFAKGNHDFTNDKFMDFYEKENGETDYETLDKYGYWDTWYGQLVGEHYGIL